MDNIIGNIQVSGKVRPGRVYPGGFTEVPVGHGKNLLLPGQWKEEGDWETNLTLFGWGALVGQLLRGAPDGKSYRIAGMYLEFENNGGAPVSTPAFDRTGGLSYYDGLISDPNRDYLRVAMTADTFDSTDLTNFPDNNRVTFFAQTTGVVGVHGKTFSDGVQSRVYGGALVAFPDVSDSSLDLIHSRFYFTVADNQLIKSAGSQLSLTWPLSLQ